MSDALLTTADVQSPLQLPERAAPMADRQEEVGVLIDRAISVSKDRTLRQWLVRLREGDE